MLYCLMVPLLLGLMLLVAYIKGPSLSLSFIICLNIFSCLLKMAINNHLLKAYCPCASPAISQIFYADDCLLIARATLHNAIILAAIIDLYSFHSGQHVNFIKSHIS